MAEGDEYYIPLSFKDRKDKSFFIETLGRMPYTPLSREKRYEYVEKGGYPLTFVDAIIENEKYRQRQLLNHVKYGDLQSQEKFSKIIDMLAMQANRIPLMKFKDIPINIAMKGLFRSPQLAV